MSQENVEVARRFVHALDRRDYEAAAACLHHAAEWHNTAAFPGPRTVIGPEEIVAFWQSLLDSFGEDGSVAEVEDIESNGNLVVIGVHSWGRSATAGVPVDVRWGLTLRLRNGRIERADVSGDYRRALEAAGLSK
jgi:ketosteroid isomerase-like protein